MTVDAASSKALEWDSGFLQKLLQDHSLFTLHATFGLVSEPSKKILATVARGKLRHGGHPVLRWNASCLSTVERNDNLMFAKPELEKSSSRIDGISAMTNAMLAPEEEQSAKIEVW